MSQNTLDSINNRFSANMFDTKASLSKAQIEELVTFASQAPSAYNLQHWRFIAVTDKAKKTALKAAAYNQQKVEDAAVTFVVVADLDAYKELPLAFKPMIEKGYIDQATVDGLAQMAAGSYGSNPQFARDEAIRSVGFSSMCLMLAAEAKGYVSGPMTGFDPAAVSALFGLKSHEVPALLITVGPAGEGNYPKKPRYGLEKILKFA